MDQLLLAVVLLAPVFLVARAIDRRDRPVEEEMTDLLLERAWVMTPGDRREAFERWDKRFGAVREPGEVCAALDAMPGGMSSAETRRRVTGRGLLSASGSVLGTLLLLGGVIGLIKGYPNSLLATILGGGMLATDLFPRSESRAP